MKRIGLLGGTFDPPHFGHLMIAQEVLTQLELTEIWFLPANVPPHKEGETISAREMRLEMLMIATQDNPWFKVSTIEFERDDPSYTVDTIQILSERFPDDQFYFIIGADMVEYLPKWKDIDELIQLVSFVGVKRPGYELSSVYPILSVEIPQFEVSSTFLRKRFAEGGNTTYFLPDNVRKFIEEQRLYGKK